MSNKSRDDVVVILAVVVLLLVGGMGGVGFMMYSRSRAVMMQREQALQAMKAAADQAALAAEAAIEAEKESTVVDAELAEAEEDAVDRQILIGVVCRHKIRTASRRRILYTATARIFQ